MRKNYLNTYKFNSVFIKIFILLIISSILPVLLVNGVLYRHTTATIQEQVYTTNVNMLSKTSELVDMVFEQTEQIIEQLSKDRSILNIVLNPDVNMLGKNSTVINALKNTAASNQYISSLYLYSTYNEMVFTSDGGIYPLDKFIDTSWLYQYSKFFLGTLRMETRQVPDGFGNFTNCITLIANLPYKSWSKQGAIVVNISEDKLYDTMLGIAATDRDKLYVVNKNGIIISHPDKSNLYTHDSYTRNILHEDKGCFIGSSEGQKFLFTYITSKYTGWKYIHSTPLEEANDKISIVSKFIIISTLAYLLISLMISFFTSIEIYNPIDQLIKYIRGLSLDLGGSEESKIKNEYDFLGYAYNDVISKKKDIENLLNNMKPMIKEKLFTNLLLGKDIDLQEIQNKLMYLKVNFREVNFICMIIQIDGYSELRNNYNETEINLYKLHLNDVIEKMISSRYKVVVVEVETDKLVAVINYPGDTTFLEEKEKLFEMAGVIKSAGEGYFPFTITLGIGRAYKDLMNVKLSYQEALEALKYKLYQGKNEIIDIDTIEEVSEELYFYDSEKQNMLINTIRVGQKKEAGALIQELYEEIVKYGNIQYTNVYHIFSSLISSILELLINAGVEIKDVYSSEDLYEQLSNKETIEDIIVWLTEICNKAIDKINELNTAKSQKNAEKILEYVHENLNSDISLNDIADWIGFSPAYVSKFFKDYVGESYTDYINHHRLKKAKQMLMNTKLSVKEIGFKTGFNSIQTFMRTFKKYEGITPGQYRNKI